MDDSLPIPPNTQKNLPGRQSRFGHRLGSLTAFRPRPFELHVVVTDPFFIASHHPLQKRVDFVAIQKRFACIRTGKNVFLRQVVWHPDIELLFESNLLQMVYNGLMTHAQLLADATAATMLFRSIQRFYRNFRRQAFRTAAHLRSPLHQNENVETIVVLWK